MNGGFRASDGYLLHYRHWAPRGRPARAQIVALHGIQSHGGWYTYSSARLADAGYEVFFLDRRGSGLNPASRGHAIHAERLVADVVQFVDECRHRQPHLPVILLGVSWGGKLAAAVAARRPELFAGVALLYPGLATRVQPRRRDVWLLRLAQARGWGRLKVMIPLNDPALFTGEPEWQEFIHRDELGLHVVTIDFSLANHDLSRAVEQVRELRLPALLMLAGRDDIIDNAATRAWFERVTVGSRKIIEYPEARHTLEFEPNPDRFIHELTAWLDELAPAPAR